MQPIAIVLFMSFIATVGIAGTNGTLEGYVRDKATNEALPNASILLVGTHLGAVSDTRGFYTVNNVPAGTYDVRCSFIGAQTLVMKSVRIRPDLKTRLDIELSQTGVEMAPIEVTAQRPPIQKDVTGTVHTEGGESFTALPVSTIGDIAGLQPGTTLEINIRGGKTTDAVYLVDGLPVQNLIEGGAGVELPQSSIAEMSVQTGGFDPEYGNTLSGVINVITKRGSDKHLFGVRGEKDDLFGGQQVDHRNEVDLYANGPIVQDMYYFGSLDVLHTDTRWWQDFQRFFPSPIERRYSGFGKVDYLASPALRVSGQLLYSYGKTHDYEYSWRFNLDGLPSRERESYRLAGIVSHTPSDQFFYTASISRYKLTSMINDGPQESIDTTLYQWDFFLRYVLDGQRSWWARREQINNVVKADLTWRPDGHHLIKFGGEINFQEIYSDIERYEPQVNIFGKPFVNKPLINYSTDFRYFPRTGSAYLQDKFELSNDGMLLNLGVRYEFLDPRAERPIAERTLQPNNEYQTTIVSTVPASVKHLFSPRIGFAAPFAVNGYLFINYGQYYQFPLFDYLYSGLNNVSLKKGVGILVGNPDLRPEATRAWEMSIKYALKNGVVLSGTYFHKETENMVDVKTFIPTNSSVAGDYGYAEFVNNPYATASGIELMLTKEQGSPITGSLSYTFMNAKGISENAREALQFYQWGFPVPARPFPLSWDQRHSVKMVTMIDLPWDFKLSGTWMYHSGRPYTYFPSKDGFTPEDSTQQFEPNNARMSDFLLLNLKLSCAMTFGETQSRPVRFMVYADGRNLLNERNVLWVDSGGRAGGELGDLSAWDPARRIRIGLRLEI
jgi:outer membrane receptor for ferrienterochelin and colicin